MVVVNSKHFKEEEVAAQSSFNTQELRLKRIDQALKNGNLKYVEDTVSPVRTQPYLENTSSGSLADAA